MGYIINGFVGSIDYYGSQLSQFIDYGNGTLINKWG